MLETPTTSEQARTETGDPIHIISLGAGVQSSTMSLMAAHGEITPMPKCAIFADTQDEPQSVYTWLDWLEEKLPFPVLRVTAGKLSDAILNGAKPTASIPSFGSRGGVFKRSCTDRYKIRPIQRKIRELGGKRNGTILWIGISLDEVSRMKPNKLRYINNIWPLIDKRMSRWDCLRWMKRHAYPEPPKSACEYCPYHSNALWRELLSDQKTRSRIGLIEARIVKRGQFLHRERITLSKVDLSTDEDHGQQVMFGNECEGLCGV
jgi:hypothetical protein